MNTRETARRLLALAALIAAPLLAGETVAPIDMLKHLPPKKPVNLERLDAQTVKWDLPNGKRQGITIDLAAQGIDPAGYDEIRFDLKPLGSQVSMTMTLKGHLEPGQISRWYLKFKALPGQWNEGRYELALDDDGLTRRGKSAGPGKTLEIRLAARRLGRPGEPADRTAMFRNLRLVKRLISADFKLMESAAEETTDEIANLYRLHVANRTNKPQTVKLDLDPTGTLKYFRVSGPTSLTLGPSETKTAPIRLSMSRSQAMAMAPLYAEPMYPKVYVEGVPDSDVTPLRGYRRWPMWGVVPVFNRVTWVPETFQAYLAGQTAMAAGIGHMKTGVVRSAEQALKYDWPVPHYGPPGHDQSYICKACRAKLKPATPTALHKHVCPKCGKVVENNPQMDRHYVRIYHARRGHDLKSLALAWLLTGKRVYADKAAKIFLGYAAVYDKMPTIGERSTYARSRLGGSSLGSSYTTPEFAQAFYYLQNAPTLDGGQRERLRQLVRQMGIEVAQHSVEYNNQQAEHFNAYGSVGLATGFWPLAAEAIHGEFGWHQVVEFGYDEDGMGHEGGAYHWSIYIAMNEFAEFAYSYGVNLYTPRFKRIIDGTRTAGLIKSHSGLLEMPYRVYRDLAYVPQLTSRADARGRSLTAALYGVQGLPNASEIAATSTLMPNAGWIFLRQGNAVDSREIRLNYIKQFDRHEADRLTTFFYQNNRQVDSTIGRISYGIDGCWWMNETAGHNCIVIDGRNSSPSRSSLLVYNDSPAAPLAVVRTDPATPLYEGVTQTRCIALIGGNYVVFDRLVADAPRTIDRYQWAPGKARLRLDAAKADPPPAQLPKGGRFSDLVGGAGGKELRIDWEKPAPKSATSDALKMRLVADQPMHAYVAQSWGGYRGGAKEATFVRLEGVSEASLLATFSLGNEAEPGAAKIVKSTDDEIVFTVATGGKTYTIAIDAKGKSATVEAK